MRRFELLIESTRADELMVTTMVYDHAARRHSYELLAQAFTTGHAQLKLLGCLWLRLRKAWRHNSVIALPLMWDNRPGSAGLWREIGVID